MKTFKKCDTDYVLIVDGMSIRKQLIWDTNTKTYLGVRDYREEINLETEDTEAKEALVMMVVGLRNRWKWPIGGNKQLKSCIGLHSNWVYHLSRFRLMIEKLECLRIIIFIHQIRIEDLYFYLLLV